MPESAPRDPAAIERELGVLEEGVEQLVHELADYRDRASAAEGEHSRLTGLLKRSGVDVSDPASLERRLQELAEENSRLKEVLREARTRAKRIRGRLIVMEDESAG
jgi:predicted RNase H-like nuclease (RuvC/YqgF family)